MKVIFSIMNHKTRASSSLEIKKGDELVRVSYVDDIKNL